MEPITKLMNGAMSHKPVMLTPAEADDLAASVIDMHRLIKILEDGIQLRDDLLEKYQEGVVHALFDGSEDDNVGEVTETFGFSGEDDGVYSQVEEEE